MSSDDDNWITGLGQRPGSAPAAAPGDDDGDIDAFERPMVQRTVDAATAPSAMPKNAFHLPFLRPCSDADEATDDAAEDKHEETPMPRRKSDAPPRRNLQREILQALPPDTPMTSAELQAALPNLTGGQLSQALFAATSAGRAKKSKAKGEAAVWQITRAGRNYLADTGGEIPAAPCPATAARPPRPTPGKRMPTPSAASTATFAEPHPGTALAIRPFEPVVERSFRCAVFSDGGFHLHKNGVSIDLSAAEHAEMLRYQERMAESPSA